ncbi:MAG: hypothetical protein ACRDLD_02470, partial [Thermoleophilaceae bacterium]
EEELVFATGSLVGRHSLAYANDDGAAIESHWRSGWFDHGLSVVKTLRETKVWGAGACQMAVSADFSEAAGSLTQMDFSEGSVTTWGGSTWGGGLWESPAALRPRFHSHSIEGTVFSTHFQNNVLDQTWAAHRLVHHQRDTRVPSVA